MMSILRVRTQRQEREVTEENLGFLLFVTAVIGIVKYRSFTP